MANAVPDFFNDPTVIADPKSYFKSMRDKAPVLWEPYHNSLMVTGYDEAMEILNTKDGTYSSSVNILGPLHNLKLDPKAGDLREQLDATADERAWSAHLTSFDGEIHAKNRQLLGSLLTYSRLKANIDYLHALTDRLIDGFLAQGHVNAASDYAHAAATYAISDLMGIPAEDRAELVAQLGAPPSQVDGEETHRIGPDPLIFLQERFDGYLRDRQTAPREDLLTELLNAHYKDGSAPDFSMISLLARFLFGAGQDTTSRLLAIAIRILGDDLEMQEYLRQNPERIPDFLEETLRFDCPVKVSYRLAMKDTQVGGIDVPAGTVITVGLMAASNDPRHFPNPEIVDIDRANKRDHMGFSKGLHGCLGAPLARMEARVALERLLARTAQFRISEEHHGPQKARRYRYEPTFTFRSLSDLHIEFDPA